MNDEDRRLLNQHLGQNKAGNTRESGSHREISAHQRATYQSNNNRTFGIPNSTRRYKSKNTLLVANNFQPNGTIDFPLQLKNGSLTIRPNVRSSVSCNISSGRWNSKLTGSSLVRGPLGAGDGSFLLSYDLQPNKLQAVSQLEIGDHAHLMAGSIYHTSTAWYGFGLLLNPYKGAALQLQSEQRSNLGQIIFKFRCPTNMLQPSAALTFESKPDIIIPSHLEIGFEKNQLKVDLSLTKQISKYRDLILRGSWRSTGFQCDVNLQQSLEENTSVFGVGLRHHNQQGLAWLFTWVRGNMKIKIPVFILKSDNPSKFVCSLYLLFVSFLVQDAIDYLWELTPHSGDDDGMQQRTRQENLAYSVTKAKLNAGKQAKLMKKQADLRRKIEIEKNGLVINRAIYYVVGGDTLDVTRQLQFWTTKSSLDLPALPKQNLLGFYDVAASLPSNDDKHTKQRGFFDFFSAEKEGGCINRPPILAVQYDFAGLSYEIMISNNEPLSLPSDKAKLMSSNMISKSL
mmetsp:Transcript_18380/g.27771  ORF Transcript_18380/g.27771 Transcript_18380/m.27771 type:complete len:513 (+) Transcript_18380:71-1609(+)